MSESWEERELVARVVDGDEEAARDFVYLYKSVVYGVLRRYRQLAPQERDDLFQSVFERLLQNDCRALKRWQGSSFSAYLRTITKNLAHDFLRGRGREIPLNDDPPLDGDDESQGQSRPGGAALSAEAEILVHELQRIMREAIGRLSAADQEVMRLLYFEELTYAEAAERLQCTQNAFGVRVNRARSRLATVIRKDFPAVMAYL